MIQVRKWFGGSCLHRHIPFSWKKNCLWTITFDLCKENISESDIKCFLLLVYGNITWKDSNAFFLLMMYYLYKEKWEGKKFLTIFLRLRNCTNPPKDQEVWWQNATLVFFAGKCWKAKFSNSHATSSKYWAFWRWLCWEQACWRMSAQWWG